MDALWLTLFPFSPFPGVADPRERTHPVPDRAGGGSRRPFEASGHRGLAPDRAQRAAQRRYGSAPGHLRLVSLVPCPGAERFGAWLLLSLSQQPGASESQTRDSSLEGWDTWLKALSASRPFIIPAFTGTRIRKLKA